MRYALRHPKRVPAHAHRVARDTWLRLRHRDHIAYYRAVMASDTARSPEAAVGHNPSVEKWERIGRMQFDYLVRHGLEPRAPDAGDRLREPAGRAAVHRPPGRRELLRDRHLAGHPDGGPAHPRARGSAGQTPSSGARRRPHVRLPARRPLRRRPRAQRVLPLPAARHRAVPRARRPRPRPRRLLRLHLRPHRGHGTPGAPRGLLLPDRHPRGSRPAARPVRPPHGRLGGPAAPPVEDPRDGGGGSRWTRRPPMSVPPPNVDP